MSHIEALPVQLPQEAQAVVETVETVDTSKTIAGQESDEHKSRVDSSVSDNNESCSPVTKKTQHFNDEVQTHILERFATAGDDQPYHVFSKTRIALIVSLVTLASTFSGLSSNIYFPAQAQISDELHISPATVNLSITTYMIAQGITPSIWGPIADVYGRRQVLLYTLLLYVAANVGLALSQNAEMLLVFRFLQAAGSSSTIALGSGVIADLVDSADRGSYLGYFSGARQISLAIGPVLGGALAGSLGYRSIFWFLFIFSTLVLILVFFCLPETLRRIAGDGSKPLQSFGQRPFMDVVNCCGKRKKAPSPDADEESGNRTCAGSSHQAMEKPRLTFASFYEPLIFLCEKDVACALFFGACIYTTWSMLVASTTILLQRNYHLTTIQIGLCFLANGMGCVLGSIIGGRNLNATFRREAFLWHFERGISHGAPLPKSPLPLEFPLEKARLQSAPLNSAICVFATLIFTWSMTVLDGAADVNVSIVVPLLSQFALGYSATAVLNSNNTLIIDLYPGKGASAAAVNNLARCVMGAVGVAVVDPIIDATSPGWLGTIMSGVVAVGALFVGLEYKFGSRWRGQRESRIQSKAASAVASAAVSAANSPTHSRVPSPAPLARRLLKLEGGTAGGNGYGNEDEKKG